MERSARLQKTGFAAFFLSGICVISSGVIVSILRELYGFSFAATGTLLSFMSIGNMAAAFLAGDGGQHQTTATFLGSWAKGIPTLVVHLQMVPRRAQHSSAPSYIPRNRMKIKLVFAK